ncbi:MAG: dephospho-CoA kinase [Candidatus Eremiobacteraeota bacterium]|nr:dephospho-CoA kinase [Candidatus Eremiobacteraeota bacterium]MBV8375182.1 dephospho-CoA kinase [Candidatus Eremiobacteraeota bacterium]
MRVGLTGGIGAGKTAVARAFEELGAFIIDTDALAREAVAANSDGLREIARVWPQVVRSGALDRTALAEIVFNDPVARGRLNAIIHPHVRRLAMEREARARPGQLIVHVVPLLFETGYDAVVDKSVLVVAPDDVRIARIVRRDRLGEADVRARIAAQIPAEEALKRADFVIENNADPKRLRARAREVYQRLTD